MFAIEQVEFLGYTLTTEGVRSNQKNVDAVEDFPRPTSVPRMYEDFWEWQTSTADIFKEWQLCATP